MGDWDAREGLKGFGALGSPWQALGDFSEGGRALSGLGGGLGGSALGKALESPGAQNTCKIRAKHQRNPCKIRSKSVQNPCKIRAIKSPRGPQISRSPSRHPKHHQIPMEGPPELPKVTRASQGFPQASTKLARGLPSFPRAPPKPFRAFFQLAKGLPRPPQGLQMCVCLSVSMHAQVRHGSAPRDISN